MSLRIALFGQAAFGRDTLERLRANGHTIAGVFAPPDAGRPDALAERAAELGLPLVRRRFYRKKSGEPIAAALAEHAALGAELNVLASVQVFLPRELTDAPEAQESVLPSVAPAALPRRRRTAVADHPGRAHDRCLDLRARRRRGHRARGRAEGRRSDRAARDGHESLLREAAAAGRGGAGRGRRARRLGPRAARGPGRVTGDGAGARRRLGRRARSGEAGRGARSPGARLRPAARRVSELPGEAAAAVRCGARARHRRAGGHGSLVATRADSWSRCAAARCAARACAPTAARSRRRRSRRASGLAPGARLESGV